MVKLFVPMVLAPHGIVWVCGRFVAFFPFPSKKARMMQYEDYFAGLLMSKRNARNQDAIEPPVNVRHRACAAPRTQQQDSPQRAEWIDDDDYFLRNRDSIDTFTSHVDSTVPRKRRALARKSTPINKQDLFNKLPDELLLHVFRHLPRASDRSSCASVSMRWLKLQSHMQREYFFIRQRQSDRPKRLISAGEKNDNEDVFDADRRVERQAQWAIGDLSRSLEGKKATDVRLAAIAVGTGGRGGLGKLCIKGGDLVGGSAAGISDVGLSAIGFCCAALRSLVLWDCPNITDKGITVIGKGCRLLQKVELFKCPLVGDSGVSSIAKNAFFLSVLSIDDCPLIGDVALHAVSVGCSGLSYLNLRNCPRVGDDGLEAVVQSCTKLQKVKFDGLKMSDKVLMSIRMHCKALRTLFLSCLKLVSKDGFLSFCNSSSEMALKHVAITDCVSFSDTTLVALGNSFADLRHISLTRCGGISDQGLIKYLQIALSLKTLHVEKCEYISGIGLMSALSSTTGSLKEIHFIRCYNIQDNKMGLASPTFIRDNSVLTCVSLALSAGIGDRCLSQLGLLCNNRLTDLNLAGLARVTDEGLLALLNHGGCNFTRVNFTGCSKLTDHAVIAIAKQCGGSLTSFVLDRCEMVTDVGLQAIGKHCAGLEDLDVSECNITDVGVRAIVSALGATLSSLNLSGCGRITNQVLGLIEENCHNLRDLNLKNCRGLTQKMINKFSARLWTCDIVSV